MNIEVDRQYAKPDPSWLYVGGWAFFGLVLLVASHSIGMLNQGDYGRAIARFLQYPLGPEGGFGSPQGVVWPFLEDPRGPSGGGGTSALLFWAAAWPQSLFAGHYSVLLTGLAARIGLLLCAERLGTHLSRSLGGGLAMRFAIGALFALALFAAHNVAFTNALYMEFAFVLFLPLVVLGLFQVHTRWGQVALVLGAVMCGAAKAQFFYLPSFLGIVLVWTAVRTGQRPGWLLVVGLVVAQVVSLVPLTRSGYTQINYHHATQLGSYLAMSPTQRAAFGPDGSVERCVGIDAWGNRLAGLDAVRLEPGHESCLGEVTLGARDVIAPYLHHPGLLPGLWFGTTPTHFTVDYFHLDQEGRYIVPVDGDGYGPGQVLVALSAARDRVIGPWVALLLIATASLAGAGLIGRPPPGLATALLFLAALAASQLVVSLVGEGVRDLSRHWAGAQLALDLLAACLVAWALSLTSFARKRLGSATLRPLQVSRSLSSARD